jgi:hypothetical protein
MKKKLSDKALLKAANLVRKRVSTYSKLKKAGLLKGAKFVIGRAPLLRIKPLKGFEVMHHCGHSEPYPGISEAEAILFSAQVCSDCAGIYRG